MFSEASGYSNIRAIRLKSSECKWLEAVSEWSYNAGNGKYRRNIAMSKTIQTGACFPANIRFQPPSSNERKGQLSLPERDTFLPGVTMHKSQLIILAGLHSFLITSEDGLPDNQYRIRNQHVEFRSFAADGPPSTDRHWRVLEPE